MIRVRCPICDRTLEGQSLSDLPFFPFCSKKCKTIDLGRWLNESNAIKVDAPLEDPEELADSDIP